MKFNRKTIKLGLIIIGTILLTIIFLGYFIASYDIFYSLFLMGVGISENFGETEGTLTILGYLFIIVGILIKDDNLLIEKIIIIC